MKTCFIGDNPNFLGGISLFQKNLIKRINEQKKYHEITWLYRSNKDEKESTSNINYVGFKLSKIPLLKEILFNKKVKKYIQKNNNFDVINSHAIWGYWMKNYFKKKNQKLINTYHGTSYYFYKNHFKRFNFLKKILYYPLLAFVYFIEKPPMKKADKIICVSEKVKRQVETLYGKRRSIFVIRTGVDLKEFKPRDRIKTKKELKLNPNNFYGLYVGGGGYWTKGFDRAVNLGKEIYKKNKNFRLVVIGPDYKKVKHLLNEEFIIFLEDVPREKMPLYYSASDMFFCMSRYEGGAPTLVVSEAMASGCLLVCSKDSEQEILEDKKNALIIENFDEKDAEKISDVYNDDKLKEEIIKNSNKAIKDLSLEKWSKRYLEVLLE